MPATFSNLQFHIVFSTKKRAPVIVESLRDDLQGYIGGIIRDIKGTLIVAGGIPDHIHLLLRLHPDTAISVMLRTIKANSSKWLREEFPQMNWPGWQTGYAAFSVSQSASGAVEQYIRDQKRHHAKRTSRQELLLLLKRHNIEVEEAMLDRED